MGPHTNTCSSRDTGASTAVKLETISEHNKAMVNHDFDRHESAQRPTRKRKQSERLVSPGHLELLLAGEREVGI
eukprot:13159135-Ditylum_brightwellii.AAC.1